MSKTSDTLPKCAMIGYSLKDYNPCVNYNKDRFCGTPEYQQMMRNVEARRLGCADKMHPVQTTYNAERNGPYAGPYTFSPVGQWDIPCGRDPLYAGRPCKK